MRGFLLLCVLCALLYLFTPIGGEATHQIDYWCGYSAGKAEVQEASEKMFGQLGLCFQRDFSGIHMHEEKSDSWNEGHEKAILDALQAPSH